jgi:multidrug efflux pump
MLYFDSQATADGAMTLTVCSKSAPVPKRLKPQCRTVNRAFAALPKQLRQIGVTTEKSVRI